MSFPEATSGTIRWVALGFAILMTCSALLSTSALINAEHTGVTIYSSDPRLLETERVSRTDSPQRFHDANALLGYRILFSSSLALVSFWFYRRLSD